MVRSTIVAAVAVALLTQCAAFGSADLVVPVTSYFDLLYTLQSGLHTNYVAEYLKCKLDGGASVNATGGSEVTAYSIDGDGVITFSATKLIFNYQSASGGYVYDHVTTVVLPNGTVSLTATDLIAPDPNSGDPFYTEVFTCQMGDGITFFTVEESQGETVRTYGDLLASAARGEELLLVTQATGSKVRNGLTISTFESFDEPAAFGPPEFSAGTSSLQLLDSGKWAKLMTTVRVSDQGDITVEKIYIDPVTLKVVAKDPTAKVSLADGSAFFVARVSAKADESTDILRFRSFIVGHFDNSKQVEKEIKANGTATHPFAQHISDIATQKVVNLPSGFAEDGRFFVLEETYYVVSENSTMSKPMLFLFSPDAQGQVTIVSYDIPASIPKEDLRNNNTALKFDYTKLNISKTFNKATYKYDRSIDTFLLGPASTPIPGGEFILTERISWNVLSVMEDVIVHGKSVMPYHTPILYDRI